MQIHYIMFTTNIISHRQTMYTTTCTYKDKRYAINLLLLYTSTSTQLIYLFTLRITML